MTLERQSTKHSPRLDEELQHETASLTHGTPGDAHAHEGREAEPPADGEPTPTSRPATDAFLGLGHDVPTARRELSRWLGHDVFPGDREALLAQVREASAPETVASALGQLPPGGRSYHTDYDVWEALTGETERAPAGRVYEGQDE